MLRLWRLEQKRSCTFFPCCFCDSWSYFFMNLKLFGAHEFRGSWFHKLWGLVLHYSQIYLFLENDLYENQNLLPNKTKWYHENCLENCEILKYFYLKMIYHRKVGFKLFEKIPYKFCNIMQNPLSFRKSAFFMVVISIKIVPMDILEYDHSKIFFNVWRMCWNRKRHLWTIQIKLNSCLRSCV